MNVEPAPRRSKREHQPSAKAALSSSLSRPPTSFSASRRSQRRRGTSASPASTPVSTRHPSPVRRNAATSFAAYDLVTVRMDAVGPNGQRRRVRAAAHTGSTTSVTPGVPSLAASGVHDSGKVLGQYSSHDCALLCEVILGQLKKQTLAPTVLDEAKSPAFIKWNPVAKTMETSHKVRMKPHECQVLWKFLAYGANPVVRSGEILLDSDEEDFCTTPAAVNARMAIQQEELVEKMPSVVAMKDLSHIQEEAKAAEAEDEFGKDNLRETKGKQKEVTLDPQELDSESTLQLYPTYSLSTGAPDAWYRPFGPKDAMPLTFVASRFLKRKTNLPVQSLIGRTSVSPVSSQSTGQPFASELNRKDATLTGSAPVMKAPKLSTAPRMFALSSTRPPI